MSSKIKGFMLLRTMMAKWLAFVPYTKATLFGLQWLRLIGGVEWGGYSCKMCWKKPLG
jgi:hypothetical protein